MNLRFGDHSVIQAVLAKPRDLGGLASRSTLRSRRNRNLGVDESLFKRIATGDQAAVRECMDRYGGLVWSLARRWINDLSDAEDATQEIFVELWKSAHRYDPGSGSETVFVSTIARRRLIDRLRAQRRRPATEDFDEALVPDIASQESDPGEVAADVEIAARAIAQLDEGQREILTMGVVQGMTHSEIADATGKPLGTVKTQLRRGLIKVRDLIESGQSHPRETAG